MRGGEGIWGVKRRGWWVGGKEWGASRIEIQAQIECLPSCQIKLASERASPHLPGNGWMGVPTSLPPSCPLPASPIVKKSWPSPPPDQGSWYFIQAPPPHHLDGPGSTIQVYQPPASEQDWKHFPYLEGEIHFGLLLKGASGGGDTVQQCLVFNFFFLELRMLFNYVPNFLRSSLTILVPQINKSASCNCSANLCFASKDAGCCRTFPFTYHRSCELISFYVK